MYALLDTFEAFSIKQSNSCPVLLVTWWITGLYFKLNVCMYIAKYICIIKLRCKFGFLSSKKKTYRFRYQRILINKYLIRKLSFSYFLEQTTPLSLRIDRWLHSSALDLIETYRKFDCQCLINISTILHVSFIGLWQRLKNHIQCFSQANRYI